MHRRSKQSGFSMLELMIVMAVIAIMAAIATPSFLSWRKDFWLKGAARDLLGNMQKAKLTAVKERKTVSFEFGANGYSYLAYIDSDNPSNGYNAGTTDELLFTETWEQDVYFDTAQSTDGIDVEDNKIDFLPTGMPSALNPSPSAVYIKNDTDKKLKVVLSQAGNIRIAEY